MRKYPVGKPVHSLPVRDASRLELDGIPRREEGLPMVDGKEFITF
jgi:hypothetical protein